MLKTGTVVDATLIAGPSSTKNSSGERDPEMRQGKKGNQWHFGMKARSSVDADSGLLHRHGNGGQRQRRYARPSVVARRGGRGVCGCRLSRCGHAARSQAVDWHVAMRPGKRWAVNKNSPWVRLLDNAEQLKASVRAKVEHPLRVIKCQFGSPRFDTKGWRRTRRN